LAKVLLSGACVCTKKKASLHRTFSYNHASLSNTFQVDCMNIVSLPHSNKFLYVEALDYPNAYDFNLPHRHDYFEVILIKESGGHQLIDFTKYELNKGTAFVVYPGQVHLLKRENAQGLVIQFRKDIFEYIFPVKHHLLYFKNPEMKLSNDTFEHIYDLSLRIEHLNRTENLSAIASHKPFSYLQIILLSLIENQESASHGEYNTFASSFLELLNLHLREKRKVSDYADMLSMNSERFTQLSKQAFGKTPLKLIHEELMLEIKRLILLNQFTLKEIAFELNFDSQANFSAFIKTSTGKTPTELQAELSSSMVL
jgi:AraC family transcriptional activator of pobA